MPHDRVVNLRVSAAWRDRLLRLLETATGGETRSQSSFVRELVDKEAALWLESPYWVDRELAFVFIDREGSAYFRSLQAIHLQRKRALLPCRLALKAEKQRHLDRTNGSVEGVIHDRWIVNRFSAWKGDLRGDEAPVDEEPLDSVSDPAGLGAKTADLSVHQPAGVRLVRETLVGVRDFVQRASGSEELLSDDRAEIPLEVPTRELEIRVVVDTSLFRAPGDLERDLRLDYEIRNLESARLEDRFVAGMDRPIRWLQFRFPSRDHEGATFVEGRRACLDSLQALANRLAALGESPSDGGSPVSAPAGYLFGRLRWHRPYLGFCACVTWPKPEAGAAHFRG